MCCKEAVVNPKEKPAAFFKLDDIAWGLAVDANAQLARKAAAMDANEFAKAPGLKRSQGLQASLYKAHQLPL